MNILFEKNPTENAKHDKLVALVDNMLGIQKEIQRGENGAR